MPMLLDPRNHNPNTLLRGSGHTNQFCGIYKTIPLSTQPDWGIRAWDTPLLDVAITADGIPVPIGDRIWRPSHVTRNGFEPDSGIQLTEQTFVDGRGIAICALQLRNAGDYSIRINVHPRWNHSHPHHPVRVSNPPGDDLDQVLPRDCRIDFVFACTWDPAHTQDVIDAPAAERDPAARQAFLTRQAQKRTNSGYFTILVQPRGGTIVRPHRLSCPAAVQAKGACWHPFCCTGCHGALSTTAPLLEFS